MIPEMRITCPHGKSLLIINRSTAEVLEVRKPKSEDSTGDDFLDAIKRAEKKKDVLEAKVKETREKEEHKDEILGSLFDDGMKKAKEQGVEKPLSPYDLE